MATYTIAQLVFAHQRTGNQVMKNGQPVYTLTRTDLAKVERYVARTAVRIAFQKKQKDQANAAREATETLRRQITQRESRIQAMNRMASR
jgi:hypothetical protein